MHLAWCLEHWKGGGVIKVALNFMTLNKTWEQPPLGINSLLCKGNQGMHLPEKQTHLPAIERRFHGRTVEDHCICIRWLGPL